MQVFETWSSNAPPAHGSQQAEPPGFSCPTHRLQWLQLLARARILRGGGRGRGRRGRMFDKAPTFFSFNKSTANWSCWKNWTSIFTLRCFWLPGWGEEEREQRRRSHHLILFVQHKASFFHDCWKLRTSLSEDLKGKLSPSTCAFHRLRSENAPHCCKYAPVLGVKENGSELEPPTVGCGDEWESGFLWEVGGVVLRSQTDMVLSRRNTWLWLTEFPCRI